MYCVTNYDKIKQDKPTNYFDNFYTQIESIFWNYKHKLAVYVLLALAGRSELLIHNQDFSMFDPT